MMTQYDSDSDVFSIISAFFHGLINIINSRNIKIKSKKTWKKERQRTTTSNMASNTIVGLVYVTGV